MVHSIKQSFCIDKRLAKQHPRLTRGDLTIINRLKKSGEYEDWDSLFVDFLQEINPMPF